MNAVEIEEAVSKLAEAAFDAAEFPFAFLEAFGNKPATIKQLRSGHSNKSDVDGGILRRNHIHLAVCDPGNHVEMLLSDMEGCQGPGIKIISALRKAAQLRNQAAAQR